MKDRTLLELGYRLQGNRREVEGVSHPDRDAQFRYINKCVTGFQRHGQPVISIDCEKKELIGNFRNGGKEWRPEGMPELVKVHDFEIAENGVNARVLARGRALGVQAVALSDPLRSG